MCLSCEMHDKWPPFIEFMIWFLLMGLNVGNHYGIWIVSKSKVIDVTGNLYRNKTELNQTGNATVSPALSSFLSLNEVFLSSDSNITFVPTAVATTLPFQAVNTTNYTMLLELWKTPEEQWTELSKWRSVLLVFCFIGLVLFVCHVLVLLPNVIKSCCHPDPIALKESNHWYFKNLLKFHAALLIGETIIYDIPVGCITMEVLRVIWSVGVTYTDTSPLTQDQAFDASKMILALSLLGLAFIALYKGMMPLFLWIGNPFCFPCIPLRLLVVLPGGLIALVMTFGPIMGLAKNRLLQFAPEVMQAEIGELARTFFSIGMIFWGIFGIVLLFGGCCWYQFCREESQKEDTTCLCC